VRACARPGVILGGRTQLGTNRVLLDIPHGSAQMDLRQYTGVKTVLPQVTGSSLFRLEIVGIAAVCPAKCVCQRPLAGRCHNPMHVIRHETVAEYVNPALGRVGLHQVEV
jgi:hypothetical protein